MGVSITYHEQNIFELLHSPAEGVYQNGVASPVRRTLAIARATAPMDTGRLKNTHVSTITDEGFRIVGRVEATAEYAIFVHEGTGLFGPKHHLIRPSRAKAMVFRLKDGTLVYARSTKGQRSQPWLVNALKAGCPWPVVVNPVG